MSSTAHHVTDSIICSCLDESKRIVGMTQDEFYPMALFGLIGLLTSHFGMGLGAMVAWKALMTLLKKDQGVAALTLLFYRHSSPFMCRMMFKAFPSATKRYWW